MHCFYRLYKYCCPFHQGMWFHCSQWLFDTDFGALFIYILPRTCCRRGLKSGEIMQNKTCFYNFFFLHVQHLHRFGVCLHFWYAARSPPKIGKNMIFFGVKSWFFTWNTPKISRDPPKIGKYDFLGVKSWFFTRNTQKIFAPPSARRNFFKCAPPNLKSWLRPWCLFDGVEL